MNAGKSIAARDSDCYISDIEDTHITLYIYLALYCLIIPTSKYHFPMLLTFIKCQFFFFFFFFYY